MLALEFEIHGASFCIALTKMDIDSIYNSVGDDIFCFFFILLASVNDHSANIFFINFHKNLRQAIATLCWIIVESSCKCAMPCAL